MISERENFKNIDKIVNYYNNWTYGKQALMGGAPDKLYNIIKEETLECADGRKKVDGPSYWELFAQFYYRDVATPEYCRWYSRKNHVFKSFGKTCLNKDGEWKVKQ